MSLLDWARKEIELACKKERDNAPNDEWNYGVACYESVFKAFESLAGDGHSGASINITKHILNRLIDGKPLTPIYDSEDVWNDITAEYHAEDGVLKKYQCKRMSSLFKTVYDDGTVEYSDNGYYYCVNKGNPNITYTFGLVSRVIHEMFPITMPYMPGTPMKVICSDILYDPANGDFDTIAIHEIVKDGKTIPVYRYFKESEDPSGWTEISIKEWEDRNFKVYGEGVL